MSPTAHMSGLRVRLSELVRVQPGYLSRNRVRNAHDGSHRLLRGKDVSDNQGVRVDGAIRFHPKRRVDLYLVCRGDILVTARGQDHRAYHIDQELSDVLAAATFYILRSNTSRIRASYLAWWLNLPRVQSAIDTASGGTYISHIRRGALESLMVSVPPLEVQHRIERVVFLWRQRNALRVRIDRKREKYIRTVCQQAVRGS